MNKVGNSVNLGFNFYFNYRVTIVVYRKQLDTQNPIIEYN